MTSNLSDLAILLKHGKIFNEINCYHNTTNTTRSNMVEVTAILCVTYVRHAWLFKGAPQN